MSECGCGVGLACDDDFGEYDHRALLDPKKCRYPALLEAAVELLKDLGAHELHYGVSWQRVHAEQLAALRVEVGRDESVKEGGA